MTANVAPPVRGEFAPRTPLPATPPAGRGFGLTANQLRALFFIDGFQQATAGISPSLTEIGAHLGFTANSTVHQIPTRLEERGHIRRLPHKWRAIEVLRRPNLPAPSLNGEPLQFIPVYHGSALGRA